MGLKDSARIKLNNITFSDGSKYDLHQRELVVLVGPNNCGKSEALKNIKQLLTENKNKPSVCIKDIQKENQGTREDLERYFDTHFTRIDEQYHVGTQGVHINLFRNWDNAEPNIVYNAFVNLLDAESRLSEAQPRANVGHKEAKQYPIQYIYDDEALARDLNKTFKETFDQELVLNFRSGQNLYLHVGKQPTIWRGQDRVSDQYLERVRELPLLHEQGDGFRSFAAIVFSIYANTYDINLIDEPEAFLHPPQARKLGNIIARKNKTLSVIATHSSDIIRGILDYSRAKVRIIRLTRIDNINHTNEVQNSEIRGLWNEATLKYSNLLEAVFHEECVICEGDADCKFYNTISDFLENTSKSKWADTLFLPSGGKTAIYKSVRALKALGVPTKVIVDIDILNNQTEIKRLVESIGGDWDIYQDDWKTLNDHVRDGVPALTDAEIKAQIIMFIEKEEGLPKGKIEDAMRQKRPWAVIKKNGYTALPDGEARVTYKRLSRSLRDIGLFILDVGEIEGFLPETGSHGPKAVYTALTKFKLNGPELSTAREFIRDVCAPSRTE